MTFMATLETDVISYQEKIINYLELQSHPNKEEIISDLLTHGRQSFCKNYRNKLSANILLNVANEEFLELFKQGIREILEMSLFAEGKLIITEFYYNIKEQDEDRFDAMLTRLAENGKVHTKQSSRILSLVLELLFPLIAEQKNESNNLWICLTTEGLQSLSKFPKFISENELEELLDDNNQSQLYLALSHYYKDSLEELFTLQHIDKNKLCDSDINSLTRNGWISGIKILSTKLGSVQYEQLEKAVLVKVLLKKSKITAAIETAVSQIHRVIPVGFPCLIVSCVIPITLVLTALIRQLPSSVTPMRGTDIALSPQARWSPNGITVAGGHGLGSELNQLNYPFGLYVDDDQTIYVADYLNHRIVAWPAGATSGQVMAGGNGQGNRLNQLNQPTNLIVDRTNNRLLICDWGNRRVVYWSHRGGTYGEIILSNISCSCLTMDERRFLYVSDIEKHEVRWWRMGDSQGIVVAGGNSQGDRLNQLNWPTDLFVDRNHSVYVSDTDNHRVIKWMKGAKEGKVVAGGDGKGSGVKQLSFPNGVVVDGVGTVYVADRDNHQIMRWPPGATHGSVVVGHKGQGDKANQLNRPMGLSFDRHGHLFIVDCKNNRVQKFELLSS